MISGAAAGSEPVLREHGEDHGHVPTRNALGGSRRRREHCLTNDDIGTHKLLGYILLGLLVFRIFWGFAGSKTARFSSFIKGPRCDRLSRRALLEGERERGRAQSARGMERRGASRPVVRLGHVGLFTQDVDGLESGPLTYLVSCDTADAARW
jgi:hypothetical protein